MVLAVDRVRWIINVIGPKPIIQGVGVENQLVKKGFWWDKERESL